MDLIDAESREIATLFVNVFISFSYPLNFVIYCCMSHIYCCMSHQFRSQFAVIFCRQTPRSVDRADVTSSRRPEDRRQNSRVLELVGVRYREGVSHVTRCHQARVTWSLAIPGASNWTSREVDRVRIRYYPIQSRDHVWPGVRPERS